MKSKAGIDVEAVEANLRYGDKDCAALLQETLLGVAFCNPMEEFSSAAATNKMPPELMKVFRIAQLTIRYLLHSQEMLTEALQNLKDDNTVTHQVL